MKALLGLLAAVLSLTWLMPEEASARSKSYRSKNGKVYYRSYHYQRPASVGPNGLCQRDTGTPTGQLNFRNRCDTEEFWNRIQSQGRRR